MFDQLIIDSTKYIILPHFKLDGDSIVFLDKYKYFVAGDNLKLSEVEKIDFLLNEGVIIKKRIERAVSEKCRDKMLIIEPHPDDFALSASGYVLDKNYGEVKVLNIFSETLVANFPWGDKFSITEKYFESMRIVESEVAIEQFLKFNFESLRLPLAQKRGHKNNFHTQKTKQESNLVDKISQRLLGEINRNKYDTVLCPLGVQKHVDHVVVFDACIAAYVKKLEQGNDCQFIFYEEYPYARNRKSLFDRLQYLEKLFKFKKILINVDNNLQTINDAIMVYRTQFDDVNSKQMLNIIRTDFERISSEEFTPENDSKKMFQRYHKLERML